MEKLRLAAVTLFAAVLAAPCAVGADDSVAKTIIGLERTALDRWGKGDPNGYLDTYASDVTYFDTATERRVDGLQAMKQLLMPIAGKIKVSSYEMIGPNVQQSGNMAVLSYNLISHTIGPNGAPVAVRWNSTAVYRRTGETWKIIHNHWSLTKPQLKQ